MRAFGQNILLDSTEYTRNLMTATVVVMITVTSIPSVRTWGLKIFNFHSGCNALN